MELITLELFAAFGAGSLDVAVFVVSLFRAIAASLANSGFKPKIL